mgnify:CR=1 FL=1
MLDRITEKLDFNAQALVLRADRQRVIASNIANVDTPNYVARDFNFAQALKDATGERDSSAASASRGGTGGASLVRTSVQGSSSTSSGLVLTHNQHMGLNGSGAVENRKLGYAVQTQPSMDSNSVDLDRERAAFADNAIRYESTLRFINGHVKTMLSAIQGQ